MIKPQEIKASSDSLKISASPNLYFDFDLSVHPKLADIVDRLIEWSGYCTSNSRSRPGRCLVLSGDSGCGKTHLINLVKKYTRIDSVIVNESELFNRLRKYYSLKKDTGKVFDECKKAGLLIYDDLGVPSGNVEWIDSVYYDLFRTEQAYLITTNKPIEEFVGRIGSRAFSRLKEAMGGKVGIEKHFINMWDIPDYRGR